MMMMPNSSSNGGGSRQNGAMQLDPQAKMMLTQAGVSNFSQQLQNTEQMLRQSLMRLQNAQNQVQVQAEGQLRELQQLEMQIAQTLQQFQIVSRSAQISPGMLM